MNIDNLITNTKPVADSFVNDQLKWRRERIEQLTQERDRYKKLYEKEVQFVATLTELVQFMTKTAVDVFGEIPNADKVLEKLNKHINKINNNGRNKSDNR